MGYHQAGFDVYGVDIEDQPGYPFHFCKHDALTFPLEGFDVIHASPPCADHTRLNKIWKKDHGNGWMLPAIVERLKASGAIWVVENVEGYSVEMDGWWFTLCGSSFGMKVRKHRRFGSNALVLAPHCRHKEQGRPLGVYGNGGGEIKPKGMKALPSQFTALMDMPWANSREAAQAVPPVFTEYIGQQLMGHLHAIHS